MSHGHTWFYSLHFGVSYSLLFAFAVCCFVKALLGPRLETWQSCSQAKQRCSCWKRTKSNPCQCWAAFAWSKVDCMQIAKHTKQAITSAFNCFVVFPSRLRCQIWRLKTNSTIWSEQYPCFRLNIYAYVFIFSPQTPTQGTPVPIMGLTDSSRYLCSSAVLCVARVRRVVTLLPS